MVAETGFQANTLKKAWRTRSICICVAPLLTVRSVKTTDAPRHFAACVSALGTEMSCCTSVVVRLIQTRNATSCCSFCLQRIFYKGDCLGCVSRLSPASSYGTLFSHCFFSILSYRTLWTHFGHNSLMDQAMVNLAEFYFD